MARGPVRKPQSPSIGEFYEGQKRQSTGFKALKLQNARSEWYAEPLIGLHLLRSCSISSDMFSTDRIRNMWL